MIHYTGTMSWQVPLDPCTASLEKVGNKLVGFITLDSTPGQEFAIELDFASPTELRNILSDSGPLGGIIGIIPPFVSSAPTTNAVAVDLSTIVLTGAPFIHVDPFTPGSETSTTFSLNLAQSAGFHGELAEGGVADIAQGPLTTRALTPVRINRMANSFDHHGYLTGVQRLQSETNSEFLKRIETAYGLPADSTTKGLQNAMARQLGIGVSSVAEVTLNPASPHDYVSAHLEITPASLKIYSSWVPRGAQQPGFVPTLELAVDLEGLNVDRVAAIVNANGIFSMQVTSGGEKRADGLLSATTRWFEREPLPSQTFFALKRKQVIPGSLRSPVLVRERAIVGNVLQDGDFYLDASEGALTMHSAPAVSADVTYYYVPAALELFHTTSRVVPISDDASSELFFEQIVSDLYDNVDDQMVPGLPTNRGYSVIRRVLEGGSYPQFWGE